jgi:hypothetical protein
VEYSSLSKRGLQKKIKMGGGAMNEWMRMVEWYYELSMYYEDEEFGSGRKDENEKLLNQLFDGDGWHIEYVSTIEFGEFAE